jgi:hypothetical protein
MDRLVERLTDPAVGWAAYLGGALIGVAAAGAVIAVLAF